MVGGGQPLAKVHAFVWDRTRSIRNDFTLQNVEGFKNDDLLLTVYCYELIARFHIHALHELSHPDIDDHGFTAHNEREQLNKTLLSLMDFYDLCASRGLKCANEAEFRAYMVLMHIYDQDVERKAMNLGLDRPELFEHPRFQLALELYAAAGNTHDSHGPLRPPGSVLVAQNDFAKFFRVVKSSRVSYTMACMAEIHFNQIRKDALVAIRAGYRARSTAENATLQLLVDLLGFDTEQEAQAFAEACGINVSIGSDGLIYLMLNSSSGHLADPNEKLKQPFSLKVVEHKRHGRALAQVIHGLTVRQARGTVDGEQSNNATTAASSTNPFAPTSSTPAVSGLALQKPLPTNPFGPSGSVFSNGMKNLGKPSSTFEPVANDSAPSTMAQQEISKEQQQQQQQPQMSFAQPGLFGSSPSSRLGGFGKPSSMLTSVASQSSPSIHSPQETSKDLGGFGKPSSVLVPDGDRSSLFNHAPQASSNNFGGFGYPSSMLGPNGDRSSPFTQAPEGALNAVVDFEEVSIASIPAGNESMLNREDLKKTPPSADQQPLRSCLKSRTDRSPSPADRSNNEASKKKAVHFKEAPEKSLFVTGRSDDEEEPSGQNLTPLPSMLSSASASTEHTGQISNFTPTFTFPNQSSPSVLAPTADTSFKPTFVFPTPGKESTQSSFPKSSTATGFVSPSSFPLPSSIGSNQAPLGKNSAIPRTITSTSFQFPEKEQNQAAVPSGISTLPGAAAPPFFNNLRKEPIQAADQANASMALGATASSTFDFPSSTETSNRALTLPSSTTLGISPVSAISLPPSDTTVLSTSNRTISSLPGPTSSAAEPSSSAPQPPSSAPSNVAQVQSKSTTDTAPSSPPREPTPPPPTGEIPEDMISWLLSDEGGLMDQLVDYVLPDIVKSAEDEHNEKVAKEFRRLKLMEKYFHRWQRNAEKRVMIRHGRRKRERMNQYIREMQQRKKRKSDPEVDRLLQSYREKYGLGEFNKPQARNFEGGKLSAIHAEIDRRLKRRSDSDLESMLDSERAKRRVLNNRIPMPRITSSILEPSPFSGSNGHTKRVESLDTSRYAPANSSLRRDPRLASLPGVSLFTGRPIKDSPLAMAATNGKIREFGVRDATKSDVWRLKAAGLVTLPNGVTQPINMPPSPPKTTKKRSLESDNDDDIIEERASKSLKRSINSSKSTTTKVIPTTTKGTSNTTTPLTNTSTTSSKEGEKTNEGEDLHAQVQKVLERMDEGIQFYREEIEKERQRQEQSKRSNGSGGSASGHSQHSASSSGSSVGAGNRDKSTPKSYTAGRWWSRIGGIDLGVRPRLFGGSEMIGSVGSGTGNGVSDSPLTRSSSLKRKPTPLSTFRSTNSTPTSTTTTPRLGSTPTRHRAALRRLLGYDRSR